MDVPDAVTSAAAGMRVQSAELDAIARNLAGAGSPGFRPEHLAVSAFGDQLEAHTQAGDAQGTLRRTGVTTDLALVGPGYFALATSDGVRYTRDGRFAVGPHGTLEDSRGNAVLGSLGPVRFPPGAQVVEDGHVTTKGMTIDRLRIVVFDQPLVTSPDGLAQAPPHAVPKRAEARVRSGYLEDSGVDVVSQMTALIATQRAFEANQKTLQRTDESLRRIVTDLPVLHS